MDTRVRVDNTSEGCTLQPREVNFHTQPDDTPRACRQQLHKLVARTSIDPLLCTAFMTGQTTRTRRADRNKSYAGIRKCKRKARQLRWPPRSAGAVLKFRDFAHLITSNNTKSTIRVESPLEKLPVEIKNMIFAYLLPGDIVEAYTDLNKNYADDPLCSAPLYRYIWHTGLLRTCRTLYVETGTYLYSRNTFVVLNYIWPDFYKLMTRSMVAGASTKNVARFSNQTMTVDFTHSSAVQIGQKKTERGHVLLLAQDLPKVLDQLWFEVHSISSNQIYLLSKPKRRPVAFWHEPSFDQTKIKIKIQLHQPPRHPKLTPMELTIKQWQLLQPFTVLSTYPLKLEVLGNAGPNVTSKMLSVMKPRIVSLEEAGWSHYGKIRKAKEAADCLLREGSCPHGILIKQYMSIAQFGQRESQLRFYKRHHSIASLFCPATILDLYRSWSFAFAVTVLDCYMVASALLIRAPRLAKKYLAFVTGHALNLVLFLKNYYGLPKDLRVIMARVLHFEGVFYADGKDYLNAKMLIGLALDTLSPRDTALQLDYGRFGGSGLVHVSD